MLASASKDGTARIWDAATGLLHLPADRHDTEVSCVAFHPSGRVLLTACSDSILCGAGGTAVGDRDRPADSALP